MERLKSVLMSLMVSSLIGHGKNLTVIMEVNFFSSTTVILQFVTLSMKQLHLTNDSISYFQLTVGLSAFLLGTFLLIVPFLQRILLLGLYVYLLNMSSYLGHFLSETWNDGFVKSSSLSFIF